ncbi:MAG: AAA family ATPase [Candidatus Altiarchaeota archaeon]|nr:AAA family ATPase [Candidatus Altiarchaeota archaeon]
MKIAVTGTPGTGKTAVAKDLAKSLKVTYVDLNPLLLKDFKLDYDDDQETWEVDIDAAAKKLTFEEDCVIDGHISHALDVDVVVVLRCRPVKLVVRLLKRHWKLSKIEENTEAEGLNVISDEVWDASAEASAEAETKLRVIEIDNTNKTLKGVVQEIITYLNDPNKKSPRFDFVEQLPISNLKDI